jgi:hypothetical protein
MADKFFISHFLFDLINEAKFLQFSKNIDIFRINYSHGLLLLLQYLVNIATLKALSDTP